MFPPSCLTLGWCSWSHRQHSSSSKHGELSWCQRARFWSHLNTTLSPSSPLNHSQTSDGPVHVLSWAGGPCGHCRISVLHRCSVLPIVFLVTMVPAALRPLTRSSRVVLGWFLAVLMITETPRGGILHGAPDRGRLTVILCFFHLHSHQLLSPSHQDAWRWSCSLFQPCVGLQSCPWHPWTALWSWPWWRVCKLIDWFKMDRLSLIQVTSFFKRVLLISDPHLHNRHLGARNLAVW